MAFSGATLRFGFATLLVVGYCCALSAEAVASCGDYLHTKDSVPTRADLGDGSGAQHKRSADDADHQAQERRPTPCDGPGCHRDGPESQWPVPPSTNVRSSNDAAELLEHDCSSPDAESFAVRVADIRPLPGFPECPDRPPRSLHG